MEQIQGEKPAPVKLARRGRRTAARLAVEKKVAQKAKTQAAEIKVRTKAEKVAKTPLSSSEVVSFQHSFVDVGHLPKFGPPAVQASYLNDNVSRDWASKTAKKLAYTTSHFPVVRSPSYDETKVRTKSNHPGLGYLRDLAVSASTPLIANLYLSRLHASFAKYKGNDVPLPKIYVLAPSMDPLSFYKNLHFLLNIERSKHEAGRAAAHLFRTKPVELVFVSPFAKSRFTPPSRQEIGLKWDTVTDITLLQGKITPQDVVLDCGLLALIGTKYFNIPQWFSLVMGPSSQGLNAVRPTNGADEVNIKGTSNSRIFAYDDGYVWNWKIGKSYNQYLKDLGWTVRKQFLVGVKKEDSERRGLKVIWSIDCSLITVRQGSAHAQACLGLEVFGRDPARGPLRVYDAMTLKNIRSGEQGSADWVIDDWESFDSNIAEWAESEIIPSAPDRKPISRPIGPERRPATHIEKPRAPEEESEQSDPEEAEDEEQSAPLDSSSSDEGVSAPGDDLRITPPATPDRPLGPELPRDEEEPTPPPHPTFTEKPTTPVTPDLPKFNYKAEKVKEEDSELGPRVRDKKGRNGKRQKLDLSALEGKAAEAYTELICKACADTFEFTEGEALFYEEKGLSAPLRCKTCRAAPRKDKAEGSEREVVEVKGGGGIVVQGPPEESKKQRTNRKLRSRQIRKESVGWLAWLGGNRATWITQWSPWAAEPQSTEDDDDDISSVWNTICRISGMSTVPTPKTLEATVSMVSKSQDIDYQGVHDLLVERAGNFSHMRRSYHNLADSIAKEPKPWWLGTAMFCGAVLYFRYGPKQGIKSFAYAPKPATWLPVDRVIPPGLTRLSGYVGSFLPGRDSLYENTIGCGRNLLPPICFDGLQYLAERVPELPALPSLPRIPIPGWVGTLCSRTLANLTEIVTDFDKTMTLTGSLIGGTLNHLAIAFGEELVKMMSVGLLTSSGCPPILAEVVASGLAAGGDCSANGNASWIVQTAFHVAFRAQARGDYLTASRNHFLFNVAHAAWPRFRILSINYGLGVEQATFLTPMIGGALVSCYAFSPLTRCGRMARNLADNIRNRTGCGSKASNVVSSQHDNLKYLMLNHTGSFQDNGRLFVTPASYLAHPRMGVVVSAVCTSENPLPPVAANNVVVFPESARRQPCSVARSAGYEPLVALDHPVVVYPFAPCVCNLLNCLHFRMAGIPKRYKGQDEVFERAVVRRNLARIAASREVIDYDYLGWVDRKIPVRLEREEWLRRYPAGQRDLMRQTYLLVDEARHPYDFMVKVEKNVSRSEQDFEGLFLLSDKHVRGISIPDYEARVLVGPHCYFASKVWGAKRSGRYFYTVGSTEEQRAEWFARALCTDSFCAAYSGDNMLIVVGEAGNRTIYCVDLSRMDMHVMAQTNFSIRLLRKTGGGEAADFFEKQDRKRYKTICHGERIGAAIEGTQPSGRGDTTINNSGGVDEGLHEVEHLGNVTEQSIRDVFWSMGHVTTIGKVVYNERPLDVEFLQQRFYLAVLDGNTVRFPGNRIGRVIARTFWTKEKLCVKKKKALVRGMVLGLRTINAHVPVLNDLLTSLELDTRDSGVYKDKEMIARERRDDFTTCASGQTEHPSSATEIASHLGVPLNKFNELREAARKVTVLELWGQDNHDVINALLDWDL